MQTLSISTRTDHMTPHLASPRLASPRLVPGRRNPCVQFCKSRRRAGGTCDMSDSPDDEPPTLHNPTMAPVSMPSALTFELLGKCSVRVCSGGAVPLCPSRR
jgi:hypothetical protein